MKNRIIFDTEQQGTDSVLAWPECPLSPEQGSLQEAWGECTGEASEREERLWLLSRPKKQQQGGAEEALAASQVYWVPGKEYPSFPMASERRDTGNYIVDT